MHAEKGCADPAEVGVGATSMIAEQKRAQRPAAPDQFRKRIGEDTAIVEGRISNVRRVWCQFRGGFCRAWRPFNEATSPQRDHLGQGGKHDYQFQSVVGIEAAVHLHFSKSRHGYRQRIFDDALHCREQETTLSPQHPVLEEGVGCVGRSVSVR